MSGTDLIHLGGGNYVVRDMYDAWRAAGAPPYNSAGRLVAVQQKAWDAFKDGTGSPADDPSRPDKFPLAHVRFAAMDIDPTPARVAALTAAGLVRPYAYEPWHWQLRNIYNYPLVYSLPAAAGGGSTAFITHQEDDDMRAVRKAGVPNSGIIIQAGVPPYSLGEQVFEALCSSYGLTPTDLPDWKYDTVVREQWNAAGAAAALAQGKVDVTIDGDDVAAIIAAIHATQASGISDVLTALANVPSAVRAELKAAL